MGKQYLASIVMFMIAMTGAGCTGANAGEESAKTADARTEKQVESVKNEGSVNRMGSIYDFEAKALSGEEIKFDKYKNHVLLIVNTASACGYTPQYKGLEELHQKYGSKGLDVLGFPCNQFGAQEPGDNHAIATFCQKNYGVDFQMFDKVDVNGANAHPLWKYLTDGKDIKWNFTKFLINKNGEVVQRYESKVTPEEIQSDIEKALQAG